MKEGRTLQDFAAEITRQQNVKKDFLVPAKRIQAISTAVIPETVLGEEFRRDKFVIGFPTDTVEQFYAPLNDNGHSQMSELTKIPKKYYDMLREYPDLMTRNLNHWLAMSDKKRMVRSLDGRVRAILSDSYRRLDNFDLAEHVLPILYDVKAEIKSCEITENRLYIKAVTFQTESEVKVGDIVNAGILISNSETGNGSLNIKPLVYRKVCSNGAIVDDFASKKYHVGRQIEMEQIEFSNETLKAEDKAFWLKIRDLVDYSLQSVTFDKIVDTLRAATEKKIKDPMEAVELVTQRYSFNEGEKKGVLSHLIEGADLSSWGLGNAVTRHAQDVDSYDRSTDLESIGFQIMQQDWNKN